MKIRNRNTTDQLNKAKSMDNSIKQILSNYFICSISEIRRIESGHINDTYLVTGDVSYICQELKAGLFEGSSRILEENYRKLCLAYETVKKDVPGWSIPEWLPSKSGGYFYRDEDGNIWRVYRYIDGEVKTRLEGEAQAFCVGEGLARLHRILSAFPGMPVSAIPHYRDLSWYYDQYKMLTAKAAERNPALDHLIMEKADEFLGIKLPADHAIHGDAKLSNAIFSKEGRIISFIDMDTLMPGNILDDLAECIRSCCMTSDKWDTALWQGILAGYQSIHGVLTEDELSLLPRLVQRNCFELGLRYYTDALSGNTYFEETHPGRNLGKAVRYLGVNGDGSF